MMFARPAYEARKVHAISASGAACRRRRGSERRVLRERILPIKAATAIGDGTHDAAADAQARRDLAMRQRALVNHGIDFVDKSDRQHGNGPSTDCGFGISDCGSDSTSIRKPEVAVFRQRIAIVVEDEDVPAVVVGIFEVGFRRGRLRQPPVRFRTPPFPHPAERLLCRPSSSSLLVRDLIACAFIARGLAVGARRQCIHFVLGRAKT